MDGTSLNIQNDNLEKLKELFPELFTESQLDWEKLKAAFTDDINFANERYVLNWAGKADAFKSLQIPTTATLKPVPEQSINFDTTQNIFIEGENLEVLKALQKSYYGKIKVIEIDPPYNTGSDSFIYPDKFTEKKEDYLKRIGDKDEEGYLMKEGMFHKNNKDSGHFHSNWLSMMYPRLFLAKNLLRDDGIIFVHIDDNEVHNLRLLMNEIFGEENFVDCIIWKKRYGGGSKEKHLVSLHEYALMFAKNIDNLNPIYIPNNQQSIDRYYIKKDKHFEIRGGYRTHPLEATKSMGERKNLVFPIPAPNGDEVFPKRQWLWSKDRVLDAIEKEELEFLKDKDGNWSVHTKQYLKDETGKEREIKAFSVIDNVFTQHGTNEIIDLFRDAQIFSFPKPTGLIKQLLNIGFENQDEIVLDFFGGSGTISQAVLELNKEDDKSRKFILVQLPETTDESSEAYKAGYQSIADIGKERVRRVINKINEEATQLELEIQHLNLSIEDKKSQINEERNKINVGLFQQQATTKTIEKYSKIIEDYEKTIVEKSEQLQRINNLDKGFKVFKLSTSNFKIWQGSEITEDNLVQQLEVFTNPVSEGSEEQNMLYELMIKAGYQLTDAVENFPILIDDVEPEKFFKTHLHIISNGELIIALDKINETVINTIIALNPSKVITLDILFTSNDQLKTNTVLQMKDAGIDFKTI